MPKAYSKIYPKPDWFYAPETTDEQRHEWSRRECTKRYRERHPERIKKAKRECARHPETQRAL